jgi:hypothetical protein
MDEAEQDALGADVVVIEEQVVSRARYSAEVPVLTRM